jgi:hypothetical protein
MKLVHQLLNIILYAIPVKTHLCASVISKIFPVVIPLNARYKREMKRGEKGEKIEREGGKRIRGGGRGKA